MRAVICGAGVAGLTLASQLARASWEVVVLARESGPADGGYLVDIAGEALRAAEEIGLTGLLRERAERVSRVCWVDGAGNTIANVDVDSSPEGDGALKILRGALEQALLENLPRSVDLRFGFEVREIRTP